MAASFEEMGSSASYVSYLRQIAASVSVSVASCDSALGGGGGGDDECRDEAAAFWLKMMAIAAILVSSAAGVAIPLVGWNRRGGGGGSSSGGVFVLVKAFAAGVILATGFVHMLHAAEHALSSPCLPATPWRSFPFPGSVAMLAALGTLIVDLVGTHFYERRHREEAAARPAIAQEEAALLEDGARDGEAVHDGHGHGHAHGHGHGHEEGPSARHVVVSQILELGIVSHSVIIGLSLGVSQSPCTIRPLVVALSFHQFFEGFALGGCIAEAQLRNFSAFMMAFFFAITTPAGIGVGTAVASFYNPNSPRALVVEGILDSMSAGILIYMALVDLIAADFLSRDMSCNPRLQVVSCIALFLGSMAMAAVAIWA